MNDEPQRPNVFVSYSHDDEDDCWKGGLRPHLKTLEQARRIVVWDDRKIDPGGKWYPEIHEALDGAAIAVCLITANYLSSDFCIKEEIPHILERYESDGLIFLPLLLRQCTWKAFDWLSEIQMLPRDGRSVLEDFQGRESIAFAEIGDHILSIADNPDYTPPAPPPPDWPPPEIVDIERLPVTGSELFGRKTELEMLDASWESSDTHVFGLVAWGGVGKSTLVSKWLSRMEKDNYRGARLVLGWSFYSQGSGRQSSADTFINAAFSWFGEEPGDLSPWDRGARLAELVQRQPVLLVLDGVEPLQSPAGVDRGELRDSALRTLLERLAGENPGLCLISTREELADLSGIEEPSFIQHHLDHVSPVAGRALLRVGGVRGNEADLEAAVSALGGHALAVNLLATYAADTEDHNISALRDLPQPDLTHEPHAQPRRVIEGWARRIGQSPELDILHQLGLFDRPAKGPELEVLRKAPAVEGLNQGLLEGEYAPALARLRDARLLAKASRHDPDSVDCHPLVREHFGERLRRSRPKAWAAGHGRLYEYLTATTPDRPDNLAGLAPLYAALVHGCAAGRHQEALDEVYFSRIMRGANFFATRKLGAFGADLAGLAPFFEEPWRKPVESLKATDQAWLLNLAGSWLQALGRLAEAAEPLRAALATRVEQKSWKEAAINAENLSELQLSRGETAVALTLARQGVEYADKSREPAERRDNRAVYADALHQAGRVEEAAALFREAEVMQAETQPQYRYLYSLAAYWHCDLLLGQGKAEEVLERAALTLKWVTAADLGLLTVAVNHLSLGRASLHAGDRAGAETHLRQAVDGLREAGHSDDLPRGLLARAELHLATGELDLAHVDLDESLTLCTRIGLRLLEADTWLGFTRLHLAAGTAAEARKALDKARTIIEETGYNRRLDELAELKARVRDLTTDGGE